MYCMISFFEPRQMYVDPSDKEIENDEQKEEKKRNRKKGNCLRLLNTQTTQAMWVVDGCNTQIVKYNVKQIDHTHRDPIAFIVFYLSDHFSEKILFIYTQ